MKNIVNILIILTVVFFSCTKKNNVESTGEVSISNENIETVNENNSPNVSEVRRDEGTFASGEYRSLSDITTIKLYLFKNYIVIFYGPGTNDFSELSIKSTYFLSTGEFVLRFDNQPAFYSPDKPEYAEYFVNFKLLDNNGIYEVNVTGSESDIEYVKPLDKKRFRLEVEYKFSPTHVVIDGDRQSEMIPDVYYMSIYENDTVDSWCGDLDIGDKVEFIELGKNDGNIQWVKILALNNSYSRPGVLKYYWCNYNMLGKL